MPTVGFWQLVVSSLPRPTLIPSLLVCSSSHHNYHISIQSVPSLARGDQTLQPSPVGDHVLFLRPIFFSFFSSSPFLPSFLVLSLVGIYFRPINCIGINWSGLFIHFINNLLYQLLFFPFTWFLFIFLNSGGDVIRLVVSAISIDSSEKRNLFLLYSDTTQLNSWENSIRLQGRSKVEGES